MKSLKYIFTGIGFMLLFYTARAQEQNPQTDSTATFKVYGVCGQCEDRIVKAAKGKGVKAASWDMSSMMLTLTYNPSVTSTEKVTGKPGK